MRIIVNDKKTHVTVLPDRGIKFSMNITQFILKSVKFCSFSLYLLEISLNILHNLFSDLYM